MGLSAIVYFTSQLWEKNIHFTSYYVIISYGENACRPQKPLYPRNDSEIQHYHYNI